MKTFPCSCGNELFFDSTQCVACGRRTVRCPDCLVVGPVDTDVDGSLRCGNPECVAPLKHCENDQQHQVCNLAIDAADDSALCDYCRLNTVIPDLTIEGNLDKWRRLESAKHRVLEVVERLGFPIGNADNDLLPKLSFEFKSGCVEPVLTGHADGCITIDLAEADSVHREKTRVEFGEPQRTLIGHFRHELGHYYWDLLIKLNWLEAFRKLFGNETDPDYASAQQRYYDSGPADGWPQQFVSEYASMHPWEDFAETFGCYLDMQSILMTANHFEINEHDGDSFAEMLDDYRRIGMIANELNRDMGLIDLVPEVFVPAVVEKLEFIHQMRSNLLPSQRPPVKNAAVQTTS